MLWCAALVLTLSPKPPKRPNEYSPPISGMMVGFFVMTCVLATHPADPLAWAVILTMASMFVTCVLEIVDRHNREAYERSRRGK